MVLDADLRRGEYEFKMLEVPVEGTTYHVTGICDVTEDYPFEAYGCSVFMGDVAFYACYTDEGDEFMPDDELMKNLQAAVANNLNSGNGMDDWFQEHVVEGK